MVVFRERSVATLFTIFVGIPIAMLMVGFALHLLTFAYAAVFGPKEK